MESTEEPSLDQIKPPRLEDAGLEDCALSPEAIQEAFFKAAMSARSIISDSDDDDEDEDCLIDPFPITKDSSKGYGVVGLDVLEEGEACVDGMHDLKIGDKEVDNIMGKKLEGKNDGNVDEEKEEEHEKGKVVNY